MRTSKQREQHNCAILAKATAAVQALTVDERNGGEKTVAILADATAAAKALNDSDDAHIPEFREFMEGALLRREEEKRWAKDAQSKLLACAASNAEYAVADFLQYLPGVDRYLARLESGRYGRRARKSIQQELLHECPLDGLASTIRVTCHHLRRLGTLLGERLLSLVDAITSVSVLQYIAVRDDDAELKGEAKDMENEVYAAAAEGAQFAKDMLHREARAPRRKRAASLRAAAQAQDVAPAITDAAVEPDEPLTLAECLWRDQRAYPQREAERARREADRRAAVEAAERALVELRNRGTAADRFVEECSAWAGV